MSEEDPVLLIAADPAFREELSRFLKDRGHPVAVAGDSAAGLRLELESEPALVVVQGRREEEPDLRELQAGTGSALLVLLEDAAAGPAPPDASGPADASGPPDAARQPDAAGPVVLRLCTGPDLAAGRTALFPLLHLIAARERERRALTRENDELKRARAALGAPGEKQPAAAPGESPAEDRRSLDRLKTDFISLISHELRTPLSTIIGFAEILANRMQESEDDFDEMVQAILRSGVDLELFLTDAIEFLQWTWGTMAIQRTEFDLVPHLQRVIRERVEVYRDKEIRVLFRGLNSLKMVADARLISSAIERVLDNAFKFSEKGGTVEIGLSEENRPPALGGATMVLKIRDHGVGLHRRQLEKLFHPPELRGDRQNRTRGHGFGLALASECLRSHGGRISVHSDGPQKGCQVSLEMSVGRFTGPFESQKILLGEIETLA